MTSRPRLVAIPINYQVKIGRRSTLNTQAVSIRAELFSQLIFSLTLSHLNN